MSLGVALGVGGAAGVAPPAALGVDVAGVAPIPGELQRHADAPAKLTIGGAGALSDVGGWVALGVDDAAGLAPPAALGVDVAGVAPIPRELQRHADAAGLAPATLTIGVTGALSDVAPIQVANTAAGLDLIKFFLARGWWSLFSSKISSMVLK